MCASKLTTGKVVMKSKASTSHSQKACPAFIPPKRTLFYANRLRLSLVKILAGIVVVPVSAPNANSLTRANTVWRNVRNAFPSLMAQWDALSEQVKYYGLISEPPDYRAWQRCLMDIPFPEVQRSSDSTLQSVYTDGCCLFPRWEHLRVAFFSAILAKPDGSFEVLGQGLLPTGCHTAYRVEIFGAAVAVRSFKKVVVTLDCKGVVDTCRYLQRLLIDHSRVVLPSDNTDLWAYLVEGLRGCNVASCAFRWVKGHQKWTNGSSLQRIDA